MRRLQSTPGSLRKEFSKALGVFNTKLYLKGYVRDNLAALLKSDNVHLLDIVHQL
jgi:hypothetical protein